jgi:hypothetical protein
MAKRTNRLAWGLVVTLAGVVVGVGAMLAQGERGVQLGQTILKLTYTGRWAVGSSGWYGIGSAETQLISFGFLQLTVTRPAQPTPARPAASTRSGSGR